MIRLMKTLFVYEAQRPTKVKHVKLGPPVNP